MGALGRRGKRRSKGGGRHSEGGGKPTDSVPLLLRVTVSQGSPFCRNPPAPAFGASHQDNERNMCLSSLQTQNPLQANSTQFFVFLITCFVIGNFWEVFERICHAVNWNWQKKKKKKMTRKTVLRWKLQIFIIVTEQNGIFRTINFISFPWKWAFRYVITVNIAIRGMRFLCFQIFRSYENRVASPTRKKK